MAERRIQTLVVGAGQAGLVMSRLLREAGREHVLVDRRATLGGGWQDRWDAFRLVSPNWTASLPGYDYVGDQDGFMPRDEVIAHMRAYAAAIDAPVELDTEVLALDAAADQRAGGGSRAARFRVATSRGAWSADDVIVAGGPFQTPMIPDVGGRLDPAILSLHAHDYRRPVDLPPGGVLLIGSGQTGAQLAEELSAAGRRVVMAVGHCWPSPRRYRGQDIFWWLRELAVRGPAVGAGLPRADRLPSPAARFACNPQLSGHGGGHDIDLRRFAAEGTVRLTGRLDGFDGTVVRFRPDLGESLRLGDATFGQRLQPLCDRYADAVGIDAAPDAPAPARFEPPEVEQLDLSAEGIGTVLWTSGYRPAFGWVHLPVLDEYGLPRQEAGRTDVPGLSFIGTPWLVDMGSANLVGLVRDAEAIAATW